MGVLRQCGWSTAGQVLAGVTAGLVIGQAWPRARLIMPRLLRFIIPRRVTATPTLRGSAGGLPRARPVVYAAPAPVVVYRPPVYVAPPAVSVGFGYYGGGRPYCYRGGCW